MEEKTILYVGGFELPDKNAAAHRVLNNGKIFRELGYRVVFLGISHDTNRLLKQQVQGFEAWSMPYPASKKEWVDYLTSIKTLKQIAKSLINLQAIIFYNYQSVCLQKALRYCKRNKIYSIVDITEWYLASKKNAVFFAIKQLDTAYRMCNLNKRADGIISISTYLTNYYRKCGYSSLIQIPPLIDTTEEKWKKSEEPQNKTKIQLVYAGSPGDIKDNFGIVLKNVRKFSEKIELHILGVDKSKLIETLGKELSKKYFGENVIIHGRVSHTECLEHIKKSDFQMFLRPENLVTRAGFPTKLGESFACGTPVITNLSSNIGDFLVDGKNGFVITELSDESVCETLKKTSELSREEIIGMKQYCSNIKCFDYRNYVNDVKVFFEKLK